MSEPEEPLPSYPLMATGKDGAKREFVLTLHSEREAWAAMPTNPRHRCQRWEVQVHLRGPEYRLDDGIYDHEFFEIDPTTIVSREMHHSGWRHYQGKGLPEAVIEFMHRHLDRRVISSAYRDTHQIFANEWQSRDGNGVWQRMTRAGLARELPDEFRYEYIPPVRD